MEAARVVPADVHAGAGSHVLDVVERLDHVRVVTALVASQYRLFGRFRCRRGVLFGHQKAPSFVSTFRLKCRWDLRGSIITEIVLNYHDLTAKMSPKYGDLIRI